MNVEIGAEAALFPEKEYISGISVAVHICWHQFPGFLKVLKYGLWSKFSLISYLYLYNSVNKYRLELVSQL
jgi:hypothetical protein